MAVERPTGLLVLADVSGYSQYVGGTELEHARMVMAQLLEVLARRLAPPLRLSAVEGDALLLYAAADTPLDLLDRFVSAYGDFREAAKSTEPCVGCSCTACRTVKDLQLKFIVHAGEFLEQNVAGHVQLFGHAVNVAHRMLKNHIPAKQYIFVTEAASGLVALGAPSVAHHETADVGEVRGSYRLLG